MIVVIYLASSFRVYEFRPSLEAAINTKQSDETNGRR